MPEWNKTALPSLVAASLTSFQIKKSPEQKKLRKATKKVPKPCRSKEHVNPGLWASLALLANFLAFH